jgi:hypothetical protein
LVYLPYPPPKRTPNPRYHPVFVGTRLRRIFDPSDHGATALTFRRWGPLLRFDHHTGQGKGWKRKACLHTDRGIYYAAEPLSSCIVEVFGSWGEISDPYKAIAPYCLASPILTRDLNLLDLRGVGAMRAGTAAAIAKTRERALSQAWARHFYENPKTYADIDGVIYKNAHNDEEALALFERGQAALKCPPDRVHRLDDDSLRSRILQILIDNNLL